MKGRWWALDSRQLSIFIGLISIELYWPLFYFGHEKQYGFHAKTLLLWRPQRDWSWNWAFVIVLLGFGIGISHNHVSNPNYIDKDYYTS